MPLRPAPAHTPSRQTRRRAVVHALDRIAWALAALFALDRLLKLAAIERFFRRPAPIAPPRWPAVTILQPISRGASGLRHNLEAHALLKYPAPVRRLLICDAGDSASQRVCREVISAHPELCATLVLVPADPAWSGGVAPKIHKLQAGLRALEPATPNEAPGEAIVFMDDDVAPRPDAIRQLVAHLLTPGTGATFGLPWFSNWRTPWSSLMSGFVNANMPLSFVALTYLVQPFRITGHITALRRDTLLAVGGLDGLERQIDDDFALARRLKKHGLRSVQTPAIYDINNDLPDWRAYATQMRRWFVLPRQAMEPSLTRRERAAALLVSGVGLVAPGAVGLLALVARQRATTSAFAACLGAFAATYAICEARYLGGRTPLRRWPLLAAVATLLPAHALATLLTNDIVEWRGQRLRVQRDGTFEVLP